MIGTKIPQEHSISVACSFAFVSFNTELQLVVFEGMGQHVIITSVHLHKANKPPRAGKAKEKTNKKQQTKKSQKNPKIVQPNPKIFGTIVAIQYAFESNSE